MRHRITNEESNRKAEYQWQVGGQWCRLAAQTVGLPTLPEDGSLEQFITEHYWGYATRRTGGCVEYHVSHVPWQVWATSQAGFEGDTGALYGSELASVIRGRPDCAFVAEGSAVIVCRGARIR
jgi:hypothetical protein